MTVIYVGRSESLDLCNRGKGEVAGSNHESKWMRLPSPAPLPEHIDFVKYLRHNIREVTASTDLKREGEWKHRKIMDQNMNFEEKKVGGWKRYFSALLEFHFFLRVASEAFTYELISSNFLVFPDYKCVLSTCGTICYQKICVAHSIHHARSSIDVYLALSHPLF